VLRTNPMAGAGQAPLITRPIGSAAASCLYSTRRKRDGQGRLCEGQENCKVVRSPGFSRPLSAQFRLKAELRTTPSRLCSPPGVRGGANLFSLSTLLEIVRIWLLRFDYRDTIVVICVHSQEGATVIAPIRVFLVVLAAGCPDVTLASDYTFSRVSTFPSGSAGSTRARKQPTLQTDPAELSPASVHVTLEGNGAD
jgi:hypothetical protein